MEKPKSSASPKYVLDENGRVVTYKNWLESQLSNSGKDLESRPVAIKATVEDDAPFQKMASSEEIINKQDIVACPVCKGHMEFEKYGSHIRKAHKGKEYREKKKKGPKLISRGVMNPSTRKKRKRAS